MASRIALTAVLPRCTRSPYPPGLANGRPTSHFPEPAGSTGCRPWPSVSAGPVPLVSPMGEADREAWRDRFLSACRREPVDRTPIWFMRQAGRYLPEYGELRRGRNIMETCRTPDLTVEITLQPLRRMPLDAAIMFSDIMVPVAALGVDVRIEEGVGP